MRKFHLIVLVGLFFFIDTNGFESCNALIKVVIHEKYGQVMKIYPKDSTCLILDYGSYQVEQLKAIQAYINDVGLHNHSYQAIVLLFSGWNSIEGTFACFGVDQIIVESDTAAYLHYSAFYEIQFNNGSRFRQPLFRMQCWDDTNPRLGDYRRMNLFPYLHATFNQSRIEMVGCTNRRLAESHLSGATWYLPDRTNFLEAFTIGGMDDLEVIDTGALKIMDLIVTKLLRKQKWRPFLSQKWYANSSICIGNYKAPCNRNGFMHYVARWQRLKTKCAPKPANVIYHQCFQDGFRCTWNGKPSSVKEVFEKYGCDAKETEPNFPDYPLKYDNPPKSNM